MSAYTPSTNSRPDTSSAGQPPALGVPQRYGQRAATAIARFAQPFLYPSRPPSAQGQRDTALHARDGTRPTSHIHALGSQTISSFHTSQSYVSAIEKPIAAIDVSPDKAHVVLAGRDILRTASVGFDGILAENVNILKHVNVKHREQLAIVDVRWSQHHNSLIATAAGSGLIVVYDLNRPSFEFTTIYEHVRQVHKLAFHPHGGTFFLSGSHDGSVKLWDLRDVRDARRSKATFQGANQGTRDVKWSTTDAMEFAAGTDSGVVQRWDMRKSKAPILQLNAHDSTCHSIDYHPFSKLLVSAGIDKKVKVWDTTRTDRRQNPCSQIQAPQSVLNVCWRYGHDYIKTGNQFETKSRSASQIVTSYDTKDLRVHVWDLSRPDIPHREIDFFGGSVSAFTWRSNDLLWLAGGSSNQGLFCQTDIDQTTRPIDRLNVNVLAVGPASSMAFFSERRRASSFMLSDVHEELLLRTNADHRNEENLSTSPSAADANFEEFGLATSALGQRRRKATGLAPGVGDIRKEDIGPTGEHQDTQADHSTPTFGASFETRQCGGYGTIHDVLNIESFKSLADHYVSPLLSCKSSDTLKSAIDIESIFLKNSNIANRIGEDGLAHIWRILAWAVRKELEDSDKTLRAEEHQLDTVQQRNSHAYSSTASPIVDENPASRLDPDQIVTSDLRTKNDRSERPLALSTYKLQSHHMPSENTAQNPQNHQSKNVTMTIISEKQEHRQNPVHGKTLPAITKPTGGLQNKDRSEKLPSTMSANLLSEFADMEEHLAASRAAMSTYRSIPRPLLKLDDVPKTLAKAGSAHSPAFSIFTGQLKTAEDDSNDSLDMLSGSLGSHKQSLVAGSFEESLGAVSDNERTEYTPKDGPEVSQDEPHAGNFASLEEKGHSYRDGSDGSQQIIRSDIVESNPRRIKPIVNFNDINSGWHDLTDTPIGKDKNSAGRWLDKPLETSSVAPVSLLSVRRENRPWQASSFLPALLSHHLEHLSSFQLPVFLIMYLHRHYPDLLSGLSYKTGDTNLWRRHNGIPANAYQYFAAIFSSYHGQLVSLRQHVAAADLRKSSERIFPGMKNKANPGSIKNLWCRSCLKPCKGNKRGFCARCKRRWGGCSVCGDSRFPPGDHDTLHVSKTNIATKSQISKQTIQPRRIARRRWLYCQTCGHGGHASCLISWLSHPESGGSCCVPGCRHACGPGGRREEHRTALARQKAERSQLRRGNGVLRDDKIVLESRAVKAARPNAIEVEMSELWNDTAVEFVDTSKTRGVVAESVTRPSFIGTGVTSGKGRWRANQRDIKINTGGGSINDGVSGLTDSEPDDRTRKQQYRQTRSGNNIDTSSDPLHLRFDGSLSGMRHEKEAVADERKDSESESDYLEKTLSLP